MSLRKNLSSLIELASGERCRRLTLDAVRRELGHDTAPMSALGFDPTIIAECRTFNALIDGFLDHGRIAHYLSSLTPPETYMASGVWVLPLQGIREEIHELTPGTVVFPFGYLPIASSASGHAICFSVPSGDVVWVSADGFAAGMVYSDAGELVPLCPDNVAKAVVTVADDIDGFLTGLLAGSYEDAFDALDSNGSPN